MNINTSNPIDHADKPLTRADLDKLLQTADSSDKLNLSKRNLTAATIWNVQTSAEGETE